MATRRELLARLGAGLVLLQAQPAGAARHRRCASMGDIERLEREIRDMNQRLQNALARVRRTGFGPSALPFAASLVNGGVWPAFMYVPDSTNGTNRAVMPFPGSVIAVGVSSAAVYAGTPGVDYVDFAPYVYEPDTSNLTLSDVTARIDAGDATGYAIIDKTLLTFDAGDTVAMQATKAGSPLTVAAGHLALVYVSFT